METQNNIDSLIIRLFSGEADASEKRKIEAWLELSAENRKLYTDLEEIWLSAGIQNNVDEFQVEEAILKFRNQIRKGKSVFAYHINYKQFLKYAAILAMILSIPLSYYTGYRNSIYDDTLTTISCAFGDKSAITLPDSSKVWLNSGSKLVFRSDFKNRSREVNLEGEAFFEVSRDSKHPFLVKTKEVAIEVLGTKFNVKAYPDENMVSTTLVEGSVRMMSRDQTTLLKPDQRLDYNRESKQMVLRELANTSTETGWKDGRLVFNNESLAELAPKLRRWFDVDIVFADERVQQRKFTGVLERESILEVISYFDLSNFVECQIKGNKIIIKSEN